MITDGDPLLKKPVPGKGSDFLTIAVAEREAGRYSAAVNRLTEYVAEHHEDAEALAHLAHVQLLCKQDAAAQKTLARAQALAPDLPVVLRNRARAALKARNIEDAAAAIARALAIDALDRENRLIGAAVLAAKGDGARAMQILDGLLGEGPNYAEALIHRAFLQLRSKNFAAAGADARRAVEIKPHLSQSWRVLAVIYQQAQQADEALSALRRYCQLEPEDGIALAELGEWLRLRGRTAEAVATLARAVELNPDMVAAWISYGAVLYQLKQVDEAKFAFKKALELDPNRPEAA